MTEADNIPRPAGRIAVLAELWKTKVATPAIFGRLIKLTFVMTAILMLYWTIIASDRYVSEANVIIQRTDLSSGKSIDVSAILAGTSGTNRADQLLLRDHLLSVDMLKKLDEALNLRAHYSNWKKDPISRMWFENSELEWFHRHYLSRVSIEFDDYAGVLRIKAQGYDAQTAQAIAQLLVLEGERFMNKIAHELAQAQLAFLVTEVEQMNRRLIDARRTVLEFQNRKGLVSPQATVESIGAIVAKLEAQRTEIQTQLAALPTKLVPDHPNIVMLKKSLEAVESQLAQEQAKLASPKGKTLNLTVDEFQRLEMEAAFAQDIYKSALVALEQGRMEATRTIKKVSVLQAPSLPEYPMEPRREYNIALTLLVGLLIAGTLKLLEDIVLDHID
jgi:capsular polysaccharide transport system permease protein